MIVLPVNMFVNMPVNIFLLVTFYCLYKAVVVLGRKINIITTRTREKKKVQIRLRVVRWTISNVQLTNYDHIRFSGPYKQER